MEGQGDILGEIFFTVFNSVQRENAKEIFSPPAKFPLFYFRPFDFFIKVEKI